MTRRAIIRGEIRTSRQRARERRNRWAIFWLALLAAALIGIQMPRHGAVGCALVDTLSPMITEWRGQQ